MPNFIENIIDKEVWIKSHTLTVLCQPDFNAYTRQENPKPKGYADNRRVAGKLCCQKIW